MALPIKPNNGLPNRRPSAPIDALPEIPVTGLPNIEELPIKTSPSAQEKVAREPRKTEKQATPSANESNDEIPVGYTRDEETGKIYKELEGYKPGVMKHSAKVIKSGGFTLDQLRKVTSVDPDFNLDDLNGSADTFLAHLRVPLDKEAQARLREERAKKEKAYEAAAARNLEDESE